MTIIKRGTISSSVVVSSSIYHCSNCDYTEMIKDNQQEIKTCPKCQSEMVIMSSSAEGQTE